MEIVLFRWVKEGQWVYSRAVVIESFAELQKLMIIRAKLTNLVAQLS